MEGVSMVEVIAGSLGSVRVAVDGVAYEFSAEETSRIAEHIAKALQAQGFEDRK